MLAPNHVWLYRGFEGDQTKTEKTRRMFTLVAAFITGNPNTSHPNITEIGWKTKRRRERIGSHIRKTLHIIQCQLIFDHLCNSLFCSFTNVYYSLLCKMCLIKVYFTRYSNRSLTSKFYMFSSGDTQINIRLHRI